ncbi:MAG: TrmH family RNA methyltransferase [Chlamydiia bacterium]
MIHLTSLKNPIVQRAQRIRTDKAFRHAEGLCLVLGDHLVKEISQTTPIDTLFTLVPYQNPPAKETFFVNGEIFEKIVGVSCHDKLAALVEIPPFSPLQGERILVFDRLQDPGNLGTLIRTMEAFGFDQAYFLDETVDPFNEKVIRASMGAVFRVRLAKGNLDTLLKYNISLIGADMGGTSISHFEISTPFALVLGHEGQGLSKELKKNVKTVKIPMLPPVESLNVAQAGAILLYFLGKTRGL